jgi:hypothetical protein
MVENSCVRRLRILAFLLDLLLCVLAADAAALVASAAVWFWIPAWRGAAGWVWGGAAAVSLAAFLLRDASGGRARRWFALEAVLPDGRYPGAGGSARRNLPLLVPIWNIFEAWPVLRDAAAPRPGDRKRGIRIVSTS